MSNKTFTLTWTCTDCGAGPFGVGEWHDCTRETKTDKRLLKAECAKLADFLEGIQVNYSASLEKSNGDDGPNDYDVLSTACRMLRAIAKGAYDGR